MEVKINREIRDYTESVYFGLSLRQFIFSIAACLVAVLLYFLLRPYFGIETLSYFIGEELGTIEDVYEPYLMQIGFLQRTPRGRCVTAEGYRHLGYDFGKSNNQPTLFGN